MTDEGNNEEHSLIIEVERLKAQRNSLSRRSSRERSRSSSPHPLTSPALVFNSGGSANGHPDTPMTPEQHRIKELEAKVAQDALEMEHIQGKIAAMQKKALEALSHSETARAAAEQEVSRLRAIRLSERTKTAKLALKGPFTAKELAAREERVMALERALARRDEEIKLLTKKLEHMQATGESSKPSSPEGGRMSVPMEARMADDGGRCLVVNWR